MKNLACVIGRHRWTIVVDHGETYRTCAACGRSGGGGGKPPLSQADLTYMKTTGTSDSSISGGF